MPLPPRWASIAWSVVKSAYSRVQATSPSIGAANVRVQGLRGRYALLLTDGLPLAGEGGGGVGPVRCGDFALGIARDRAGGHADLQPEDVLAVRRAGGIEDGGLAHDEDGFIGQEAQVVGTIADWIEAHPPR